MADGSSKPIDKIQVGEPVKATNPALGLTVTRTVTALHDDLDTDMADVTVKVDGHKPSTLHTTQNHPFWNLSKAQWTRADHLRSGDSLESTSKTRVRVLAVRIFTRAAHRYNLTVADLHTYYVLAGATPVLVHNCGGGGERVAPEGPSVRQDIIDETVNHADQFVNRTSKKFSASFISDITITMVEAHLTGQAFVGGGASEVAPGVFRNGNRRYRVDPASVQGVGHWPNYPHVHFEIFDDLGKPLANNHVPLIGGS
jgi:hypothetical protein